MNSSTWPTLQQLLQRCCCPPGYGVYTVYTGAQQRAALLAQLYPGENDPQHAWQTSLTTLPTQTTPLLLGISSDAGGGILRGANWGPLAVREMLYASAGQPVFDLGDIRVIPQLLLDDYLNRATLKRCRQALYGTTQTSLPVSPLSITAKVAQTLYQTFPHARLIGLGGDHSVSYPLVTAYLANAARLGKRSAVIHFDAHTDLLAQRLGIPICFGSWAYHALRSLPSAQRWLQVGIRSSGHDAAYWQAKLGVTQYWADSIHAQGAAAVAEQMCAALTAQQVDEVYVTFDIDALDLQYAGATGTPEVNGLTLEQVTILLDTVLTHFPLGAADVVEVAPFVSPAYSQSASSEPATTLQSAVAVVNLYLKYLYRRS